MICSDRAFEVCHFGRFSILGVLVGNLFLFKPFYSTGRCKWRTKSMANDRLKKALRLFRVLSTLSWVSYLCGDWPATYQHGGLMTSMRLDSKGLDHTAHPLFFPDFFFFSEVLVGEVLNWPLTQEE